MDYVKELNKIQSTQQTSQLKNEPDVFVAVPATELVFTDLSPTAQGLPTSQRSVGLPNIRKISDQQMSLALMGIALLVALFCLPFAISFVAMAWDGYTLHVLPAAVAVAFFWFIAGSLLWSLKLFFRRHSSESPFHRSPSVGLAIVIPALVVGLGFGARSLMPRGIDVGHWLGTEQTYAAANAQAATDSAIDAATPAVTAGVEMDTAKSAIARGSVEPSSKDDSDIEILTVSPSDRSPNEANAQGQTAVHTAVQKNDPKTLHTLLVLGGRGDIGDHEGQTALHLAVRYSPQILSQLLQAMTAGAQYVDKRDAQGQTPLMLAAASGNSRAVDLLVMASASTHLKNREGLTARQLATRSGHTDIAKQLTR